jgi:hypothetical protein
MLRHSTALILRRTRNHVSLYPCTTRYLSQQSSPAEDTAATTTTTTTTTTDTASTKTTSFFSYTSGRARRRRQRQELYRKHRMHIRQPGDEGSIISRMNVTEDKRTIRDLLFPVPDFGHKPKPEPPRRRLTFMEYCSIFRQAWIEYRASWDGFWTSQGFLVEDSNTKSSDEFKKTMREKQKEVEANVKRNVKFLKRGAAALQKEVSERSGIQTTEDLKRVAAEGMKLMTECVKEFMAGYRKGRDDEVEKMLNEYFQQLKKEAEKPKRRRPKRIVRKSCYYTE